MMKLFIYNMKLFIYNMRYDVITIKCRKLSG